MTNAHATEVEVTDGLRWSALDAGCTGAWSELTNLLAVVERTEEFYSAEDLAEELAEPGFDPAADSWAVWDGAALVAFGQLRLADELLEGRWCQLYLDGGVHPDWRGRGIGRRLMDRMERRARELAAARHPGAPIRMRASGRLDGDPVRPLLARRGYRIARYFTDMERALPGAPLGPVDARVRRYTESLEERVRLAHNDAFATHWGSTAQTPQAWRDRLGSRAFRPHASVVWLAGGGAGDDDSEPGGDGGEVLAYVLAYQWVDGELYIGQVGTRQRARGRGLARACLVGSLHAAIASGRYRKVELSVDSENPTGAGALYESVGFVASRAVASYVRDEDSPAI